MRRFLCAVILGLAAVVMGPPIPALASDGDEAALAVSSSTYYVDCEASVPGDGSAAAPFGSIAEVNAVPRFSPGTQILFRAGSTCEGQLVPKGNGTLAEQNVISSYGDGELPVIDGAGASSAVLLKDISYWTVDGLSIRNTSTDLTVGRQGITAQITERQDQAGIVISNNHIEDVAGWSNKSGNDPRYGLSTGVMVKVDKGTGAYSNVQIVGNEISDTGGGGIKIAGDTDHYHQDVYIAYNEIHNVGGDGIVVHNTDEVLVEHNRAIDLGQGKYPFVAGNFAGMWPYNSRNPVFQYNVVGNSVSSDYDSTAWDCDISVVGTCLFQYNYSYGNAGGFFLDCVSGCGSSSTQTKTIIRYNIAQDDCRLAGSSGGPGTTWVYNNVFYCPTKDFLDVMTGPRQFFNNVVVSRYARFNTKDVAYSNNAYFGGVAPPATETNALRDVDPKFLNPGTAQDTYAFEGYRLQGSSPLIGAGTNLDNYVGQDIFGQAVGSGDPNIGVYAGDGEAAETIPWEKARNTTAIAHSGNPMTGAVEIIDGEGRFSFDEGALLEGGLQSGQAVDLDNFSFVWDSGKPGTPDAVKTVGQEVQVSGHGSDLVFVGFSVGSVRGGDALVKYSDGSSEVVNMKLPKWTALTDLGVDAHVLAEMPYQNQHTQHWLGGAKTIKKPQAPNYVHYGQVPIDPSKSVTSVRLPDTGVVAGEGLTLFSLGVGGESSGEPDPGPEPGGIVVDVVVPTLESRGCGVEPVVVIPQVTGIEYVQDRVNDVVSVVAKSDVGYVFKDGVVTQWSFDIAVQSCAGGVDPKVPQAVDAPETLATTGASNATLVGVAVMLVICATAIARRYPKEH